MKITELIWNESDDFDNHVRHVTEQPTLQDVEDAFRRLEGSTYDIISLKTEDPLNRYPSLMIIGGADVYYASLEYRDENGTWTGESIITINPELYGPPQKGGYRVIGKGYSSFEIDEYQLINDSNIIWQLIQHFEQSARWDFNVPFAVENANLIDYGYGIED